MPRGKVKRVQVLVGTRKGAFVFTPRRLCAGSPGGIFHR
jgi:hypothetical protein